MDDYDATFSGSHEVLGVIFTHREAEDVREWAHEHQGDMMQMMKNVILNAVAA